MCIEYKYTYVYIYIYHMIYRCKTLICTLMYITIYIYITLVYMNSYLRHINIHQYIYICNTFINMY